MTPEGKTKLLIRAVLKTAGDDLWCFMPVQTGYGVPALDYVGCHRGQFFSIEAKRPGGRMSDRQEATRRWMQQAGGKVFFIDGPDGIKELEEWLSR
jgi:hypothetical protein